VGRAVTATGFRITAGDVEQAAEQFASAQQELCGIWGSLGSALVANAGMAGNDSYAATFTSRYQPGAGAAWKAFAAGTVTLNGISRGLTQTVNNYLKADHHSAAGVSGPPTQLPFAAGAASGGRVPVPPSAFGPGRPGLPGPLTRLWPDADPGKLRAAGHSWHLTAGGIERMNAHLDHVIASLADSSRGDDVTAIEGFWAAVHRGGDPHTVMGCG
jgi:hypothetical protein